VKGLALCTAGFLLWVFVPWLMWGAILLLFGTMLCIVLWAGLKAIGEADSW